MRYVIRACYPSRHSREKIRYKDRQAERMMDKRYSFAYITDRTGKDAYWLELVEELRDEAEAEKLVKEGLTEVCKTCRYYYAGFCHRLPKPDKEGELIGICSPWKNFSCEAEKLIKRGLS